MKCVNAECQAKNVDASWGGLDRDERSVPSLLCRLRLLFSYRPATGFDLGYAEMCCPITRLLAARHSYAFLAHFVSDYATMMVCV